MSRLRGTKKGKKINKKKKNNKISEALLDNIGPRYQRYATMEIMGSRGVQWTASGSDFIWGVERNRGGEEEKRYEFSRRRSWKSSWAITVRSRTMLGHRGRKMCVFLERGLVRALCPPRFVRESFVTGIVMAR